MSAAALIADCQKRLEKLRGGGGWFSGSTSGGGSSIDHGTYRSVIAPYHDRVFYEGRVAWGALVQANEGLYTRGDWDSTGALVYSFDRHFDANPQQLERIAANVGALKNAMPKDALLVTFAAEVRNDTPREIDRLVPPALCSGKQVRYETVYIQRHRLPTGYLAGQFFPVIISTSQPTQPMVLPLDAWTPELAEMWKAADRKKPTGKPPGARERPPIGGQPQRYHDDGYAPSPGAHAAPVARPTPGLQFGGQAPASAGYGNSQGGHGAHAAPVNGYANPSGYGNADYGNAGGYGSSGAYGVSAAQGNMGAYGGQSTYGGKGSYNQPYTGGAAYGGAGVPSQPVAHPAPPPAPAPQQSYGQPSFAQPAFVQPPPPAPAPAPRLDPAVEAFAAKPLQLTPAAAGSLKLSAGQQSPSPRVRVSVADNNVHRLDFAAGDPNPTTDFVYDSAGVTLVVDLNSARTLTGVQVDFGPTPHGIGFVFRRVA